MQATKSSQYLDAQVQHVEATTSPVFACNPPSRGGEHLCHIVSKSFNAKEKKQCQQNQLGCTLTYALGLGIVNELCFLHMCGLRLSLCDIFNTEKSKQY